MASALGFAQMDGEFTLYNNMKTSLNPSFAGSDDLLHLSLANKMQWVGIPNAPNTFQLLVDMPANFLLKRSGLGFSAMSEKLGLFNNTSVHLQYSYGTSLFGGILRGGLQFGLVNQQVDPSKMFIPADNEYHEAITSDPSLPSGESVGMAFDLGFGLNFQRGNWYAGLSLSHITSPEIRLNEKTSIKVPSVGYLMGGYRFEIEDSKIALTPSALLKTDFVVVQPSFSVDMDIDKMYFAGLNYRWGESLGLMLGIEFKRIRFGYAYDLLLSSLNRVSSGSQELFVSYSIKLNQSPVRSKMPRKSVKHL